MTNGKEIEIPMKTRFQRLWLLVGNTPMVEIHYRYQGKLFSIFAKCEHYNLTGSIKDRMALYIMQKAYAEKVLRPGRSFSRQGGIRKRGRAHIVEATSGNTGISFAALGAALGHPVTIIMPDWLSRERMDIIKSLGADIKLISKEKGGFKGCIEKSITMALNDRNVFLPKQFENDANAQAHAQTTGPEIWKQLQSVGLTPDAFVAGVGTGGTVMGMCQFLKAKNAAIKVHPLEPQESPTLSTGYKIGSHRIQGISDEFIPAIVDLSSLDGIIQVSDGDAILMAQSMGKQLGLAVGISSGANVLGAIKIQQTMGADAVVVTVLPDSNKKYLSTDLMREEKVKEHYITPLITLDSFKAV